MKLNVLREEYFACRSCTDCCRRQMVELFEGEPEKISQFKWPAGDPLNNVNPFSKHGGKTYFAHKPDGACVFLNESNGLCRIHEEFGPEAKCVACRIFPFQITPTFAGEASVTARYDCPTVRRNEGDSHSESLPLLRKYTDKWVPTEGFDEKTRCHLERDQIEAVAEFVATLIGGFERNDERALFIVYLCDALALTGVDQLDRKALATAFLPLKQQVADAVAGPAPDRPGLVHRMAFRTLLALHLRRDEDILDRRAGRVARLLSMIKFVFGFGSFRGLGLVHPPGSLKKAGLFEASPLAATPVEMALLWRLVRNKVEAIQFMGKANRDRDFLTGLRSLALLYPLTLATARYRAANRGATQIEPADVDYAVAAIDHSFGRAAVLRKPFVRTIETLLLRRDDFTRLVRTI